jgi:sulfur carrier protein
MKILLNGEQHELADSASVRDAIAATGAATDGRGVAVALDGEVVPRRRWDEEPLADGARVEVVQAVQGG